MVLADYDPATVTRGRLFRSYLKANLWEALLILTGFLVGLMAR